MSATQELYRHEPEAAGARGSVRVVVAMEDELSRRGLKAIISAEPDIDIVGEVTSGGEVLRAMGASRPHVVIVASDLPPGAGAEFISQITKARSARVIVVGMGLHDTDLASAIQTGAGAFLPRTFAGHELVGAVRAVAAGGAYLTPSSARRLFDNFMILPTTTLGVPAELKCLSSREVEVVRAIGRGAPNRLIARELCLSEATVKSYVTTILRKLDVRDRLQLALLSWRLGLVPVTAPPSCSAGSPRSR